MPAMDVKPSIEPNHQQPESWHDPGGTRFGNAILNSLSVHDRPLQPQPMDGLSTSAPPPFLTKTYDMVEDSSSDAVVSWSESNNSFVVWNMGEFQDNLLPKYFKHNNFSSFVRQLNTYGFRKVDPDRWEFANEGFLRGQRHLLKTIVRRKPVTHAAGVGLQQQAVAQAVNAGPCLEVGKFGLEGEVEQLKRDKNVLMMELVRVRQQQQEQAHKMEMLSQRQAASDQRQQQMMAFLAKAVQNPSFLAQLVQQNESNKHQAFVRKKRRLPKHDVDMEPGSPQQAGQIVAYSPSTANPQAMLMHYLNGSNNMFPSGDDGHAVASFLHEMNSVLPETRHGPSPSRPSGVTLEEMHTVTPLQERTAAPLPSKLPTQPSPPTMDLSQSLLVHGSKVNHLGMPGGFADLGKATESDDLDVDVKAELPLLDFHEGDVCSPLVDLEPGGNIGDAFWQQLLAGQPETPGSDLQNDMDSASAKLSHFDESDSASGSWWNGDISPGVHMDHLAEQLGQLDPGAAQNLES